MDNAKEEVKERSGETIFTDEFSPEPTVMTPGQVKKPNLGQDVPLSDLASDQESYTGPKEGMGLNEGKLSE